MRGVGCVAKYFDSLDTFMFPSPQGVWVVSSQDICKAHCSSVSVPVRGVGCVAELEAVKAEAEAVSVPVRGVGCVKYRIICGGVGSRFRPREGCGLCLPNVESRRQ